MKTEIKKLTTQHGYADVIEIFKPSDYSTGGNAFALVKLDNHDFKYHIVLSKKAKGSTTVAAFTIETLARNFFNDLVIE